MKSKDKNEEFTGFAKIQNQRAKCKSLAQKKGNVSFGYIPLPYTYDGRCRLANLRTERQDRRQPLPKRQSSAPLPDGLPDR